MQLPPSVVIQAVAANRRHQARLSFSDAGLGFRRRPLPSTLPAADFEFGTIPSNPHPSSSSRSPQTDSLLLGLRSSYRDHIDLANSTGDHKLYSRDPAWRAKLDDLCAQMVTATGGLGSSTRLIRSSHSDRAQSNTNPARVAVAMQPALAKSLVSQEQVDRLTGFAREGVRAKEFRDLDGPATILGRPSDPSPEDEEVLLDFFYEHAAAGRIMTFADGFAGQLDTMGELVLSPSFVVRATGKKPRPVSNLSATEASPNPIIQALNDSDTRPSAQATDRVDIDYDGFTTISGVCKLIMATLVAMILLPGKYNISDITQLSLLMIVMDGDAAFYRLPVHASLIGVQATRIGLRTFVMMCCIFGWAVSSKAFSHVSAAISAVHSSCVDTASFITVDSQELLLDPPPSTVAALLLDTTAEHSGISIAHVDEFASCEILGGGRPQASASDLMWAIKHQLGHTGLSIKKFAAGSFWSFQQRMIGAWFDLENFSVTMPRPKVLQALELINSDEFSPSATAFPLAAAEKLLGVLRWVSQCTPIGDSAFLIGLTRQRKGSEDGSRLIKPWRHFGEADAVALRKGHNDLLIRRYYLEAAALNPLVASASMVSLLKPEDRLLVPGQSQLLAWYSGDLSLA